MVHHDESAGAGRFASIGGLEDEVGDGCDTDPAVVMPVGAGLAAGAEGPDPDTELLSEILFVMWGYPELTQTFIHRELRQLSEAGGRLRLLAAHRVGRGDLDPATAALADTALYLGSPAEVTLRGHAWAAQHPVRFAKLLRWARRLPHRTRLHRARMSVMAFAAAAAVSRVQETGCGYLHAHFASYQTEWAVCLSRLVGIPYGFTAHATDIYRDRNLLAEKIRGARLVISCTQYNVDHLRAQAPDAANRVHLVRHGLDLSAFGPPAPLPELELPHWVAIGRLMEKKGFSHLIDAVAELEARGAPVRVTLLGGGPLEAALRKRIAERGVEHRVELRGAVENREVLAVLAGCTGLVVPSVRAKNGDVDGIPNVILEAAAMGRPVVASALSGIPEALVHEQTGLLVPPGDAVALASALEAVGRSRDWASALGRRGRALVERDFDVVKNTSRHRELLLRARRAPGPVIDPEVPVPPFGRSLVVDAA